MTSSFLDPINERRSHDAKRYAELDSDLCQVCHAYGADKRSFMIRTGYDMAEGVPEFVDMFAVPGKEELKGFFFLNICKSCRGDLIGSIITWFKHRSALRGEPKDHDGYLDSGSDEDRNIPVRINGAIVMMNTEEYDAYRVRKEAR